MSEEEQELDSNAFAKSLADMEMGSLLPRLSEDLTTLVNEVSSTGRAGALTLKLSVKPTGMGQIEIVSDVANKLPKPPSGKSIFFVGPNGELLRNDPRQKKFGFAVEDKNAPRKAANQ